MSSKLSRRAVIALLAGAAVTGCSELYPEEEPSRFWAEGRTLFMTGTIFSRTPELLSSALASNPQVTEIAMLEVPGSANDAANLRAARMVRAAGLNTRLLPDSLIASGGTDFFVAGRNRVIAPGAMVGVHSWSTIGGLDGASLPRDAREHQDYLSYFRDMGVPDAFYWFTLQAASSEGMYWMSRSELRSFNIVTRG